MTLYCITHKPVEHLQRWAVTPVAVGSWTPPSGYLRDNIGDHIAGKNRHWCELTAQYWLWRNVLNLEAEEQINGFCHYRRFFVPQASAAGARCPAAQFPGYSQAELTGALLDGGHDVVLPEPMRLAHDRDWRMTVKRLLAALKAPRWGGGVRHNWSHPTVYSHYAEMHFIDDLMEAIDLLPSELARPFRHHVLQSEDLSPYNMFIARNTVVLPYFEQLFSWLGQVELAMQGRLAGYDRLQTRLMGFLSERFCSFYFRTLHRPAYLPVCFIPDV